jgi:hypothetical protein
MKPYDPQQPLLSLHVPKCAGQSFRGLLQRWYGGNFFIHYFQQHDALPPRHEWKPGTCIHGHFQRQKGMGVEDYYPQAGQFITVLRDPLEIAISNYFFWKRVARKRQMKRGTILSGGEHDYRDIDDFFRKRPHSHILNFLPGPMTRDNFREILESRFVWIGLVENLDESVPALAERLGFRKTAIERVNASSRDEEVSVEVSEEFLHNNPLEFEIFRYVREWWRKTSEGPGGPGVEG